VLNVTPACWHRLVSNELPQWEISLVWAQCEHRDLYFMNFIKYFLLKKKYFLYAKETAYAIGKVHSFDTDIARVVNLAHDAQETVLRPHH